ncbi:MAG: glycosyltransferase family 9 protein [Tannerellaceae bacterium]|jgi:ADP-heptose:LPS heptosyltransferase|nr:glycosyltransferase family 9 protein [Tannerellaceae bacterium]
MDFKHRINNVRGAMLRKMTKYIGFSNTPINVDDVVDIKRILICRPNGRLGNQILITPLIQDILTLFPDCKIDLFVKGGLSSVIFENYHQVDRIIKLPKRPFDEFRKYIGVWFSLRKRRYDLVVNVIEGSSSGRLSTRIARAKWRFFNNVNEELKAKHPDYDHMAKFTVYNLRHYLPQFQANDPEKPIPTLNIKLSPAELEKGKELLDRHVDSTKKTICVYTFATGDKCYSKEWWAAMYKKIKETYEPSYNILEVLPAENVSQINFEAPAYYSKDIREITAVIANSVLFLGADSGIMHLASASQTPIVGLFSITDKSIYEPYGNHSVPIDTNTTDTDGIIAVMDKILNING